MSVLNGKTVAVIGYGAQGRAQALCMRDSGVHVIIGIRPGKSWDAAAQDGFEVMPVADAAAKADIIHILLPDEHHGEVYETQIKPNLTAGKTLCCSHGFAYVFKTIVPPADVDVIMVAPKGPGTEVRRVFEEGFGCPGLIAVWQNPSGNAQQTALAMAKAEGLTRGGVLECTMQQETYEDLFGEQNVLCGGLVDLMKYGFETLIEAGYPAEMAYFECVHEAKLILQNYGRSVVGKKHAALCVGYIAVTAACYVVAVKLGIVEYCERTEFVIIGFRYNAADVGILSVRNLSVVKLDYNVLTLGRISVELVSCCGIGNSLNVGIFCTEISYPCDALILINKVTGVKLTVCCRVASAHTQCRRRTPPCSSARGSG